MDVFLKSFIIGFSIAAPVGPIGVLCIRRTLTGGRTAGILSGLGAATADMLYACLAVFGVRVVVNILLGQQMWLRLGGGIFLGYLGVRTLLERPARQAAAFKPNSLAGNYFSTFLLTLSNPMTIISFSAVIAGLGMVSSKPGIDLSLLLIMGVFTGSACWWLLLSGVVHLFRARLSPQIYTWVNRISGAVILLFGVLSIYGVLAH